MPILLDYFQELRDFFTSFVVMRRSFTNGTG